MAITLDDALQKLAQAMSSANIPLWSAPQSTEILDQINEELAPLLLPADLREFWSRVDSKTLSIEPYPWFTTPEFALDSWEEARDEFRSQQPLALFFVGYQSHGCLAVELDTDGESGGAVYEWFISDPSGFDKRFESLPDWIDYVSDLVIDQRFERRDRSGGRAAWRILDEDFAEREQRTRPVIEHVGHPVESWPARWQQIQRLEFKSWPE